MKNTHALIAMACTVVCATLLLLGGGMERIGQVALAVYAVLIAMTTLLVIFGKDSTPETPLSLKILARASYLYVVAASAFTGHMIIAFVLASSWVLGSLFRAARKIESEKAGATKN